MKETKIKRRLHPARDGISAPPWKLDDNNFATSGIYDANDCAVVIFDDCHAVCENDIHLMAVAPDLLAALDLAETYLEDGAPATALRVIKDAIAKAKLP